MANVAAVHGIGQQQSGRNQLLAAWLPALRDGIERAVGLGGPAVELDIGFYADLYAGQRALLKGADEPPSLDADDIAFLAAIEGELVDEAFATVPKGFAALPAPLGRLAAWLDRRFGVAGRLLFFGDLVQVRRYQSDDALAEEVRARVRGAIAADTRVLIGHSLGSIVAYETLCLTPEHGVDTLITLGSPLGLSSIQKALRTRMATPQVAHWVNVYDVNDPVACAGPLGPSWALAADHTVENGGDAHAAVRYLGKLPTGAAVVAAL